MQLILDQRKAAEAAAFLLKRHGGRLNYTALIKLLYMADRIAFLDSGLPITGDYMVSMDNGTVLSGVYDLIKGVKTHPDWSRYIVRDSYDVALVNENPSNKHLSPYELQILERVDNKYGQLHWGQLCDLTHKFPEWHDPQGSSERIDPVEILKSANKSPEEIEEILKDLEEFFFLKTA